MLGKGRVQQRAINELMALPVENPLRASSLGLLYNLQAHLAASQQAEVDEEDRELIMALAPLYQEQLAALLDRLPLLSQEDVLAQLNCQNPPSTSS